MSGNAEHQSVRELELARKFSRVLQVLPYEVILRLTHAMVPSSSEEDVYQVYHEKSLTKKGDKSRQDVAIPFFLPASRLEKQDQEEPSSYLYFELKLGAENLGQVEGYVGKLPGSIIVSLARSLEPRDPVHPNIVRYTWTAWYKAFRNLLGLDARSRLPESILLGNEDDLEITDVVYSLDLRCEMYVEEFLRDLSMKGLVRMDHNRVMVVSGENAVNTTNDGWYQCPENWNMEWKYLSVVHGSKVQFRGVLTERWILEDNEPKRVDAGAVDENGAGDPPTIEPGLTYIRLRSLSDEECEADKWPGSQEKYADRGAFTQSHRYFSSPEEFRKRFRTVTKK